jgi:hypothetical protein
MQLLPHFRVLKIGFTFTPKIGFTFTPKPSNLTVRSWCTGAVELRNEIGRAFHSELPGTLIFDYPTVSAIAGLLSSKMQSAAAPSTTLLLRCRFVFYCFTTFRVVIFGVLCGLVHMKAVGRCSIKQRAAGEGDRKAAHATCAPVQNICTEVPSRTRRSLFAAKCTILRNL